MLAAKLGNAITSYRAHFGDRAYRRGDRILMFSTARSSLFANPRVGGLADRMKGLLTAYTLAIITNRRFLVRWTSPFALERNFKPSLYDWTIQRPLQGYLNEATALRHINLVDRADILESLDVNSLEQMLFGDARYCVVNANSLRLNPFYQTFGLTAPSITETGDLVSTLWRSLFEHVPTSSFSAERDRFDALRNAHDLVVGVHLRTGGGNGWDDPQIDDPSRAIQLLSHAEELASARGAQNPAFYFVSDSQEARGLIAQLGRADCLVELEPVSHIDRSSDQNERANDLAFHEFEILRNCQVVVAGKGGFALMAALTADVPFIRSDR